MDAGIIVLGHGSRADIEEANKMIYAVSEMLRAKINTDLIETALLNPQSGCQGIFQAAGRLVQRGAGRIIVAPMFFSSGVHIKSSVPAEIAKVKCQYPAVPVVLARPLGADPRIAAIIEERIHEAMQEVINQESSLRQ